MVYLLIQKLNEIQFHSIDLGSFLSTPKFIGVIILVVALSFLNYAFEIKKWRLLLNLQVYSFLHLTKAFLSGSSISLFLPFRSGEYLGRIVHFEKREWSRVIISSIRAGLLQLIVTLIAGMACSVFVISKIRALMTLTPTQAYLLGGLGFVLVVLLIIYVPRWIEKLALKFRFDIYPTKRKDLLKPFFYAVFRYVVFVFQYVLFMVVCDVATVPQALCLVPVFLLIQSIVPTVFLSEIGLRAVLGMYLFFDNPNALVAIFMIYLINILIPALIGVVFLKRWKS